MFKFSDHFLKHVKLLKLVENFNNVIIFEFQYYQDFLPNIFAKLDSSNLPLFYSVAVFQSCDINIFSLNINSDLVFCSIICAF